MANTPTGIQALDGNYKQQYPSKIENLVPECALIYKAVPFVQKSLQNGSYYIQPVILADEQGWTYQAPDSTDYDLKGNVSMATKPAQVLGSQLIGQAQLGYEAAARAMTTSQAFEDAVGLQMRVLKTSGIKRLEVNFLYGGTSIALAASSANVNTTSTAVTIKLSDWSAAFWSGMTGAKFDLYQSNGTTIVNTVGTPLIVSTVNAETRVVTFTSTSTADITAVDAYILANANVAQFFFFGANGTEAAGLKKQLTNTGLLFNINATTWDLWRGNTYAVGGVAFTFSKMQAAIAKAVNRGLQEEVNVYVNPNTWQNLMTDQAALRMYTSDSSEFKNGAEKLTFMSQNGRVNVMSHLFVKEGDAFIVPMGKVGRFGATDITFNIPGTDNGRIFIQIESKSCFEYRCYSNQTLFLEAPAQGVYVSGIVN